MEQKTEASQAVDDLVRACKAATSDAEKVAAIDAYRAALKAQPAPTEATQGNLAIPRMAAQRNTSNNSSSSQPSGNTGELAQGWDVDDLISSMGIGKEVAAARAEIQADPTIIPSILAAHGEDSARLDAALIKAREWIVKNHPALTLSRAKTIDEYMSLLDIIDRARASAETGGVK